MKNVFYFFVILISGISVLPGLTFSEEAPLPAATSETIPVTIPPAAASSQILFSEQLLFMEIPMVVTASKKSESIDVAPNVMYVITKEEIKKYGYQTITDILNRLPGFFTSYKPLEPVAQVRGIAPNENNKVTYMINGHRINNVNESTDLILPYSLDNVEKVEIIIGPGSVLYGAESLLAIINMITKKEQGTELVASYGSNRTLIGTAMAGVNLGEKKDIFFSGTYAESDGWDSEAFYRHSGERIGTEGQDILSRKIGTIRPSGYLFAGSQLDDVYIQFTSLNQAIPEYSQNRESAGVLATRYDYVDSLMIEKDILLPCHLQSTATFSYDDKRMIRAVERNWAGSILDTHQKLYKGEYAINFKDAQHYLQAGLQYSGGNNRHNYNTNGDDPSQNNTSGTAAHIIDNFTSHVYGGFFSEEYKFLDQLTLVAAVRGDATNLTKNEYKWYVSPRVALVSTLTDSLILKIMYNTATKFPSPWESKYNQLWNHDRRPVSETGDDWRTPLGPAYEPEKLTTYEFQAISYFDFYGRIRLALNGYMQQLDDMISWSSGFTNIGDFQGKGVELEIKYSPADYLNVWVNGSWQNARFNPHLKGTDHGDIENPDGEMYAVPQLLVNLGGIYQFTKDIALTGTIRYFNNQVVKRYPIPNYTMDRTEWQAYLTDDVFKWEKVTNIYYVDLSFTWDNLLLNNLGMRLSGKNILDNRSRVAMQYANGDFQPQGRSLEISLFSSF